MSTSAPAPAPTPTPDWGGSIGLVTRATLYREIAFEQYRKPFVAEYPANAIVLNPRHTAKLMATLADRDAAAAAAAAAAGGTEDKSNAKKNHRERKPRGVDDDDPRYQLDEELLCNDEMFYSKVLRCRWLNAGVGAGCGLQNLGNTCYLNSVLQAMAYVPPLAQYFLPSFKAAMSITAGGPTVDFAFNLAEVMRKLHRQSPQTAQASAFKPTEIVNYLKVISKHLRVGQQCDAHEFFVYLMQSVQGAVLFRLHGAAGKKLSLRVGNSTSVMRLVTGYLRSQVAWSRRDELHMLRQGKHIQAAADLELAGKAPGATDTLHSNTYDPFTVLSLTIAGSTLEHCLAEHCRVEQLDGRCYLSPRKVGVRATKCFRIHIPPPVLVIQLKRFDMSRAKVNKRVAFPMRLDVAKYCTDGLKEYGGFEAGTEYVLSSICVHEGGSLSYGHYIAYVHLPNKLWACCDDASVRMVSEDQVFQQQAYLLFYTKIEKQSGAQAPPTTATKNKQEDGIVSDERRRPSWQPTLPSHRDKQDDTDVGVAISERDAKELLSKKRAATAAAAADEKTHHKLLVQPEKRDTNTSTLPPQDAATVSSGKQETSSTHALAPRAMNRAYEDSSEEEGEDAANRRRRGPGMLLPRGIPAKDGYKNIAKALSAVSPLQAKKTLVESDTAAATGDDAQPSAGEEGRPVVLQGTDALKQLLRAKKEARHATIERPRHAPRMRVQVRDEQWEKEYDKGRQKKVRRTEERNDDENNMGERVNKFQVHQGVQFDSRGRRHRSPPGS